jgi:hypothetical protein
MGIPALFIWLGLLSLSLTFQVKRIIQSSEDEKMMLFEMQKTMLASAATFSSCQSTHLIGVNNPWGQLWQVDCLNVSGQTAQNNDKVETVRLTTEVPSPYVSLINLTNKEQFNQTAGSSANWERLSLDWQPAYHEFFKVNQVEEGQDGRASVKTLRCLGKRHRATIVNNRYCYNHALRLSSLVQMRAPIANKYRQIRQSNGGNIDINPQDYDMYSVPGQVKYFSGRFDLGKMHFYRRLPGNFVSKDPDWNLDPTKEFLIRNHILSNVPAQTLYKAREIVLNEQSFELRGDQSAGYNVTLRDYMKALFGQHRASVANDRFLTYTVNHSMSGFNGAKTYFPLPVSKRDYELYSSWVDWSATTPNRSPRIHYTCKGGPDKIESTIIQWCE